MDQSNNDSERAESIVSYDSNKYKKNRDDRDSVDTIELLKESADSIEQNNDKSNNEDVDDEINELKDDRKSSLFNKIEENFSYDYDDDEINANLIDNIKDTDRTPRANEQVVSNENLELEQEKVEASENLEKSSSLSLEPYINKKNSSEESQSNEKPDQKPKKYKLEEDDDYVETSDLMHLEPKLRDAWIKMRKLDKILMKVCKREKLVKRETLALIEKNRAELELLRLTTDHKESKMEAQNTAHFLALSYIDLDDELEKDYLSIVEPLTPVFKTQIPEMDETASQSDASEQKSVIEDDEENKATPNTSPTKPKLESSPSKKNSLASETLSSFSTKTSNDKKKTSSNFSPSTSNTMNKQNPKDFIKRNIKLAQDAAGVLAMTDEEKQRLNELLLDLEKFDSSDRNQLVAINETDNQSNDFLVEYNPYAVKLIDGDGFLPERGESDRLKRIDYELSKRTSSRQTMTTSSACLSQISLNHIAPNHIKSATSSQTIDSDLYSANLMRLETKQIKLNDEFDENDFGDKFIRDARLSREQEMKLKLIDSQLERLKMTSRSDLSNGVNHSSSNSMHDNNDFETNNSSSAVSLISHDQLKLLLDECYTENNYLNNINFNGKLDTLKEEDSFVSENITIDQLDAQSSAMKPYLNQDLLNSLLEQAKNEGIIALPNNAESNGSETERSFYEEALEIIASRPTIEFNPNYFAKNFDQDQTVPSEDEPTKQRLNSSNTRNISRNGTPQMQFNQQQESHTNSDSYFLNGNKSRLPPINKSSDDFRQDMKTPTNQSNNDLRGTRDEMMGSRQSTSSSIGSSTILPKIDDRFLPPKNA